jgi:ribosomal-protein-alanine N-acetyltransferase
VTLPTLKSDRLVLRPLVESDSTAMHAVFGDDQTMRYWSSPPHETLDETRDYVMGNAQQDRWLSWALTESGGEALGWVVLGEHRDGVRELGYILRRDCWGRGYACEAVTTIVEYGFRTLRLRRIFADCDPDNLGSIRILERLGFHREGHLRAEWETHIGIRDSLIFGMLSAEWQ